MLLKIFFNATGPTSLEEYRSIVKSRVRLCWCLTGLGVLTLCATLLLMGGQIANAHDTAYLQGVWCGIGAGLIVSGLLSVFWHKALLKDEAKLRKKQLEEQDERNQAILTRASVLAAAICFVLLYVALLVSSFLNLTVFYTLGGCLAVFVLAFLLCKAICTKKM